MNNPDDIDDDRYDDERPRRRRRISCSDRMCGADDCQLCRPENFRGGAYIQDIRDEEAEEEKE
jgi:hypothetical protein